jgi:hypothetical protein
MNNAKAESFMKTLKTEVNGKHYKNLDDARNRVGAFIENVYNAKRLHSARGYRPPEAFEAELNRVQQIAAAAQSPNKPRLSEAAPSSQTTKGVCKPSMVTVTPEI